MIKVQTLPDDKNKVVLSEMKTVYVQEADSCDSADTDLQQLEVSTADAGAGHFLTIKTERWAFDKPEELLEIIEDFRGRLKS